MQHVLIGLGVIAGGFATAGIIIGFFSVCDWIGCRFFGVQAPYGSLAGLILLIAAALGAAGFFISKTGGFA